VKTALLRGILYAGTAMGNFLFDAILSIKEKMENG